MLMIFKCLQAIVLCQGQTIRPSNDDSWQHLPTWSMAYIIESLHCSFIYTIFCISLKNNMANQSDDMVMMSC